MCSDYHVHTSSSCRVTNLDSLIFFPLLNLFILIYYDFSCSFSFLILIFQNTFVCNHFEHPSGIVIFSLADLFVCCSCSVVLRTEPRVFHVVGKVSATELHCHLVLLCFNLLLPHFKISKYSFFFSGSPSFMAFSPIFFFFCCCYFVLGATS